MRISLTKKPRKPFPYKSFILYRWFAWHPVIAEGPKGKCWVWFERVDRYWMWVTHPCGYGRIRSWTYLTEDYPS